MLNIKIARLKKGLTQKQLAEKLGLNLNTISRWETGATAITLDNLKQLADVLETSIDFLVGRE